MKEEQLDAQADGAFGGKHVNRRAGYTNPLGMAMSVARKGGTLAAGEGLQIIEHYEQMVMEAFVEGRTGVAFGESQTKKRMEEL